MKWIAISGSWRYYSADLEKGVRETVNKILREGNSIVTGGALGVDYFATDEVLKKRFRESRIKVFIPTTLDIFISHYHKRAFEGVISFQQFDLIRKQLLEIKRRYPYALIENSKYNVVNEDSYFNRNQTIIDNCDSLIAFHVNKTKGTQDAIDKAVKQGKQVSVFDYTIVQKEVA